MALKKYKKVLLLGSGADQLQISAAIDTLTRAMGGVY